MTTILPSLDGTENFYVCDFCEEDILLEEIKEYSHNQQYCRDDKKLQKYLYKVHRGTILLQ
ncbi:hypothetical protein [Candidatus Harpocratesius sp.]